MYWQYSFHVPCLFVVGSIRFYGLSANLFENVNLYFFGDIFIELLSLFQPKDSIENKSISQVKLVVLGVIIKTENHTLKALR